MISRQCGTAIKVGLMLLRNPLLAPPMSKIEQQYSDLMHIKEIEDSYLSDHEIRLQSDMKSLQERLKEGITDDLTRSGHDFEDQGFKMLQEYINSPRTDNGSYKELTNCQRLQCDKLIMLKNEIVDSKQWNIPTIDVNENHKSLREAAEELINSMNVTDCFHILSNSPSAHCIEPLDNGESRTLFIYKGIMKKFVDSDPRYYWISANELKHKFIAEMPNYLQIINKCII
ncbi:hypothetical protein GJ496_001929 [Pomphorhynchus laevis]|nr:hypothetical protein GJ496_001929 [Pomphorhynchus laevis]